MFRPDAHSAHHFFKPVIQRRGTKILSQDEVARLIDTAEFPFHRILLMTLYATGARRAEVARLKISDVDSQRMIIHIRGCKDRKDRDVMLSPKLSMPCAFTGACSSASLATGSFLVTDGTRQTIPAPPRLFGQLARAPRNERGLSTNTSIHIPCVTVATRICSKPAPICEPFRCYWAIVTWRRWRSICISPGISAPAAVLWMHSRSGHQENRYRTYKSASSSGGRHRSLCRTVLH